jgi:GntP family gluconate:H+ symporter
VGFGAGLPLAEVINAMKDGFGHILKSLGFIIVLGTSLGILLERNRSTTVMATTILKIVGQKRTSFAMNVTGFIVGLPIFCDSGFIVLNGLNLSLAKKAGISVVITSVCLATGLYAVHCLLPPHPGATAAANLIGADFGTLILYGIIIAIPGAAVGYLWATFAGNKIQVDQAKIEEPEQPATRKLPSTANSFLPVVIPLVLITSKSFYPALSVQSSFALQLLHWLGEPIFALTAGVLLAIATSLRLKLSDINKQLQDAVEKAGSILVIIGAGGAFGAVLATTKIGTHLSNALPLASMGILFPFLITSLLKTAQGSSTVAIITAAYITAPMLVTLGLDSPDGKILGVLAMGAGSMMVSHANDAYFWVIAKFADLDVNTMLRVYSVATILMGLTTLAMVYVLSLIL